MHPFCTPWKCFQGVEKECIGNKWVKVSKFWARASFILLKKSVAGFLLQFVSNKATEQNGCFKKTKLAKPAYQGVRNIGFSENLVCFVFLKYTFWDLPFCLFTEEFWCLDGCSSFRNKYALKIVIWDQIILVRKISNHKHSWIINTCISCEACSFGDSDDAEVEEAVLLSSPSPSS